MESKHHFLADQQGFFEQRCGGHAGAAFNLGLLYEEQGQSAKAIELYEEARRSEWQSLRSWT